LITPLNYLQISQNYLSKKETSYPKTLKHRLTTLHLCTLFLHHFEDEVALNFIQTLLKNTKIGVVINDLHRHWMAYSLFKLLTLVLMNKMTREDGLTSILKAFKREDLEQFSKKLNYKSTITWRWIFRYQWIINKT